jgi:ribose 5-phosphate isomerase A
LNNTPLTPDQEKALVGAEIAKLVWSGETIGVGTGSTVDAALRAIAARVRDEKLTLSVVPTSLQSGWFCREIGLTVLEPATVDHLNWGFDGADEVDPKGRLIKGKGGAMLQEKILAAKCERFIVVVDSTKVVANLGSTCAIPVEVVPSAVGLVKRGLSELGATDVAVRQAVRKHGPVISEAGNIIIDAKFSDIKDSLEGEIAKLVGVVESGLFVGFATEAWVARGASIEKHQYSRSR